jgi:hypothetical protein
MFKAIFLLDCDECGRSFDQAVVLKINSTAISQLTELQKRTLEQNSERFDWKVFNNHCMCPNCIQEDEKMAEWYSEEYRD